MNKKITLLVASLGHGGAEKVCMTLSNEFAHRGYETELWIVGTKDTSLIEHIDHRVIVFQLNKKHIRNSIFALVKLFLQRKPKKLLIFHIELAIISIFIKKIFFQRTTIFVRSINTLSLAFKDSLRKVLMLKIIKFVLPYSNKIIAQSSGMKEDLMSFFHTKESRIVTIFNPSLSIVILDSKVLKKVNFENEFLFVGRFRPQKGLVNLLNAFKIAYNKNPDIHLTLVGDGMEMELLKKEVVNLGLSTCVTFEGYQSNSLPYFKRAKATLLTSFFEGFPNVLVESIATGTPVISFDCPSGPQDIIVPGVNGILVPHLNLEEFANAILAMANGEIKFNRDDVIKTAEKFSIEKIVKKYEQVLLQD